jgi:hypothetical protein
MEIGWRKERKKKRDFGLDGVGIISRKEGGLPIHRLFLSYMLIYSMCRSCEKNAD